MKARLSVQESLEFLNDQIIRLAKIASQDINLQTDINADFRKRIEALERGKEE